MIVLLLGLLSQAAEALPTSIQDTAPPPETPRPSELAPVDGTRRPFVDLDWLEVGVRGGMAFFSEDFEADPSPSLALQARAPMPWLSPSSNPEAELFGLFVQLSAAKVERDLHLQDPSGTALFVTAGADYTFIRDGTWLLMAHAGPQYVSYGGVSGLKDGFGLLAGLRGGVDLGRGFSLSGGPEAAFGNAGDRVMFAYVGFLLDF